MNVVISLINDALSFMLQYSMHVIKRGENSQLCFIDTKLYAVNIILRHELHVIKNELRVVFLQHRI